jgi:hypothetical protein
VLEVEAEEMILVTTLVILTRAQTRMISQTD